MHHGKPHENILLRSLAKWIWGGNKKVSTGKRSCSVLVNIAMTEKLLWNMEQLRNLHLLITAVIIPAINQAKLCQQKADCTSNNILKIQHRFTLSTEDVLSNSYKHVAKKVTYRYWVMFSPQINHSRVCLGPDRDHVQ